MYILFLFQPIVILKHGEWIGYIFMKRIKALCHALIINVGVILYELLHGQNGRYHCVT